jgi:hypothetical protein
MDPSLELLRDCEKMGKRSVQQGIQLERKTRERQMWEMELH